LQEMAYPAVTRCATSSRHPLSAFLTFEQAQIISGYTTCCRRPKNDPHTRVMPTQN
jgi:hypothetical protein